MSVEASAWAWNQPVNGNRKLVLLALADHADREGVCWPGLKGLAAKCGIGERAVKQHTRRLEADGYLTRERRRGGRGVYRSNVYAELRPHPVFAVLNDEAARGQVPSESDLDALGLPPAERRRVAKACREAADIRRSGEPAQATAHAREAAASIVDSLPDEYQRPDYLKEPEPETNDPRALAAGIRRW